MWPLIHIRSLVAQKIIKIIVASKARDSIIKTIRFLWYTQWPTLPVLIIPELGGSEGWGGVGRGANPLSPNSSQTINFFQKAIMQDEYW